MDERIFDLNQGIRIKKIDLLILATVFCTFEISYFSYVIPGVKLFYLAAQSLLIAYGMLNILIKKMYGLEDILLILFLVVEFVSTIINHEEFKELILNTEALLMLYISFKWAFNLKPKTYIYVAARYTLLLTLMNTLSAIICYPRGLFYYDQFAPAFIIGADNTSTRLYIISLVFCFIESRISKSWRNKYLYAIGLINFIVFVLVRDIGNGKMCAIIFVAAHIIFQILKFPMIKQPMKKILIGNYALFLVMVVFNKLDIFSFIIVNVLHRDLTLTNRTIIWKIAINKVIENPIIGNGYMSGQEFESMLPAIIGVNAHNTILMVAFIGGAVLSFVFAMILFVATSKYDKIVENKWLWMLPVSFLGMFLRSQIEGGDAIILIAMAVLISNIATRYKKLNLDVSAL